MPLINHIDGPNRDIYLSADTVGASVHPIDIFKEYRALRRTDDNLRKFAPMLSAKGNDFKGGGKYTERYVIEHAGTRIIPYDVSHTLTIIGTIITDDGQEGISCFDRTPLSATTRVDINYVPPQVEIIRVTTDGTDLTAAEIAAATVNMLTSRIIENGNTNDDLMRLMASVLLGKVTGAGTGTERFRDLADTKDRVVATIDNSGNRTAITLDAS